MITAFRNIRSTNTPYYITIEKAYERIQEGKSKDLIEKIRSTKDKEKRNKLKTELPSICFGGEFSQRSKEKLIKSSGFMVTDYDEIETEEEFSNIWNNLKNNNHTYLMFKSPSFGISFGLKAVIRIPEDIDHKKYTEIFTAFEKDYPCEYWDSSNSDISRVCYESYDADLYLNKKAEIYDPIIHDKGFTVSEKIPFIPIDNEDFIIEKIMKFNFKKDFNDGERNNFIFDIAGLFCEYGVSKSTTENYILNNVIIGQFSEKEAKTAIGSAYKIRQFGTKYFEDYPKVNKIKRSLKKGKKEVLKEFNISENTYDEIKQENEVDDFWFKVYKKDGSETVKIDQLKYKFFLESLGYRTVFINDEMKPTLIKVESSIIEETSEERIKHEVLNYLIDNNEGVVWNHCASSSRMFKYDHLTMLDPIDLLMINDTKEKSFIAYKNGILSVSKDKIELIDYLEKPGFIWKSQIINRDFKKQKSDSNDYKEFLDKISGGNYKAFKSVVGYLCNTYKNKINNKAVILNDQVISDNPEGGTGKGLFVQGIKQVRNVSILDGKTFDDKKSFPYQTISKDCQVLVFDDIKKNWDFESKFSLVTEGITLERKNKDAIKLSVEESPKMLISTNYAVKGSGNSHDRRRHEMEVAQFFGAKKTPYDLFKRQLFEDWDYEHFSRFDNFIANCIQFYFNNGLIEQQGVNIDTRKFIAGTSMEFFEWMEERDNFVFNIRHIKSEKFEIFTNYYPDYKKWLTRKRFNIWVENYARYKGMNFDQGKDTNRWFGISENESIGKDEYISDVPF